MTDILCRWLNEEVRLSRAVDPPNIAKDFSSGYLIGEVLHKYHLQSDFSMFMKKDTSISKLNNFTRLEPTLRLLRISFDINTAQDLIEEKEGVAARLLYQLYISLEKTKKAEISETMMEIMQPAAIASRHKREHEFYSNRLQQVVRRDAERKLEKISQHFVEKGQQVSKKPVVNYSTQRPTQLKRKKVKDDEKTSIDEALYIQVPKPPPYISPANLKRRQQQHQHQLQQQQQLQRKEQQAQAVQAEIAQFETKKNNLVTSGFTSSLSSSGHPLPPNDPFGGSRQSWEVPGGETKLKLQSSRKYIQEIRQRLEENAVACEQREKRLNRFLVEQLKAHESQEELRREEHLVKRLTRLTRQEQRLAAQLLQIRMQKEVIRENRLVREQQYQLRRERDFLEALDREAALAQEDKLNRADEIAQELEFCERIAAERAQIRYEKHFESCKDIVDQIVDLATKMGEYRLLTGNVIPEKQMKEWMELLLDGVPLYEPVTDLQSASVDPEELKKQEILNNQDYDEYTNMVGEWIWPEEVQEMSLPLTNNDVLGRVVHRLKNSVQPLVSGTSVPSFPSFSIKACVLGKCCAEKIPILSEISKALDICVLSAHVLLQEALEAHRNREEAIEDEEEKIDPQVLSSPALVPSGTESPRGSVSFVASPKSDVDIKDESKPSEPRPSTRAVQGEAAEKVLRKGDTVSDELLVDIIVEAIRKVPAHSGWILEGFPSNITQARLLETALGGSVDGEDQDKTLRTNLALDPSPPPPPPPPPPVLDVAMLLDFSAEHVITQALMQSDTLSAEGTTSPTMDKNLYLAQIPHRITGFQDAWPELEEWFGDKQKILVHIDAEVSNEEFANRVASALQPLMRKPKRVPYDRSRSRTKSCFNIKELKIQRPMPWASSRSFSRRQTIDTSAFSLTSGAFGRRSSVSVHSLRGSSSQSNLDGPGLAELPHHLSPYWDKVCEAYVNGVKAVMEQLRSQRTVIIHHIFYSREGFKHFLGRPDLKQELVSQCQKDFNTIKDDMREDEETRAELHLRIDELCERLWDIGDKRKEEDEQERFSLMFDGWLEDHTAVLINHHCVLIQAEQNRFHETLQLLRFYYQATSKRTLSRPQTNIACIPLLDTPVIKEEENISNTLLKTESAKFHDRLTHDCEHTFNTINALVAAEIQQWEASERSESVLQEEEKAKSEKGSAKEDKKKKDRHSAKKQRAAAAVAPPTPTPAEAKEQETRAKLKADYGAALQHEANAAKVRMTLVKSHGLRIVDSLQSAAQESFSSMQEWLEERYIAEMKSIDQLVNVLRFHIETGAKLQNQLVLECSDFFVNEDYHMVPSPVPPQPESPLEKPLLSTPTIVQLQSLYEQISSVAPSGFMCSSDFFSFLRDVTCANIISLPDPWRTMNETKFTEIVSLLIDGRKRVDWRRFLLCAALPWPIPTLTQLLDVRKSFKETDIDHTGFISEEQYMQTELWFSADNIQTVPDDPSLPVLYDRLANLHKFFFKLFADGSFSPPQLDYISMLQYFAADSNPRQGFTRALSVVLGQHFRHSSPDTLVKSLPNIEETAEFTPSELDDKDKKEDSRDLKEDQEVSISALLAVTCYKSPMLTDSNLHPPYCLSQEELSEHLIQLFNDLEYDAEECVPFSALSQHPFYQELLGSSSHYQLVNIHKVILSVQEEGEAPPSSTAS